MTCVSVADTGDTSPPLCYDGDMTDGIHSDWVDQIEAAVLALHDLVNPAQPVELARLVWRMREARGLLKEIEDRWAVDLGEAVIKMGGQANLDGLVVHGRRSGRSTGVGEHRDALVKAVIGKAEQRRNRWNPVTGAWEQKATTRLRLLLRCFRPEPRWSEIKELGIDRDEYVEATKYATTAQITPADVTEGRL